MMITLRLKKILALAVICLITFNSANAQNKDSGAFQLKYAGLKIDFAILNSKYLRLQNFLPDNYTPPQQPKVSYDANFEVFLHNSGEMGTTNNGQPGIRLIYVGRKDVKTANGKQVIISQKDPVTNLLVESYYEFNDAAPVVRRYTKITNNGVKDAGIEMLSSAILNNFSEITGGRLEDNIRIHYAYNSLFNEAQWQMLKPSEIGRSESFSPSHTTFSLTGNGSMSTNKYLPMGMIENIKEGIMWFWQIEHNGSWNWSMGSTNGLNSYLYMGGPDDLHAQAWKNLKPGESYQTVPVALGCIKGGLNEAIAAITRYRRAVVMRPNEDNVNCPVIFNDYMNCLWADPTTEKILPLINAAAAVKSDYYVMDAGWYAEVGEGWYDKVGKWEPTKSRFPNGLKEIMDRIKEKGLKPGIWLEIEVAGVNSPLKNKPDSWFMMRHGKRVEDAGRYMLDFRNPEVVAYADEVVDRLIKEYDLKYIKIDYNSKELIGTETNASSPGQGLLEINRAVIQWFKKIHDKYPGLVIEACASGGNRLDYAMLSQNQLVSFSDQSNYKKVPAIVVGALADVLPEQLGIWSYPLAKGNAKEASFNMVNAMLGRIHLSGQLAQLSPESLNEVKTGIEVYKRSLAKFIPQSVPFFPLGMPSLAELDKPVAVGLMNDKKAFIAVWGLKGNREVKVPLPGKTDEIKLLYPGDLGIKIKREGANLVITFPDEYMAGIVKLKLKSN